IDWSQPAAVIHNRVRGLQPWPLASTSLDGRRYVIRRSAVPAIAIGRDGAGSEPGRVLRAHGDELIVACGEGTALQILEIQPEGKRTMTTREFLAGRGAIEGALLGS